MHRLIELTKQFLKVIHMWLQIAINVILPAERKKQKQHVTTLSDYCRWHAGVYIWQSFKMLHSQAEQKQILHNVQMRQYDLINFSQFC